MHPLTSKMQISEVCTHVLKWGIDTTLWIVAQVQGTGHRLGELMGTHSVRELVQHRSQQPVGSNQVHHPEGLSNFI